MITGIDHVQITVPGKAVADARAFYCELLGLRAVEKPDVLHDRGGSAAAGFLAVGIGWAIHKIAGRSGDSGSGSV